MSVQQASGLQNTSPDYQVIIGNTAAGQNPDTGQLTIASLLAGITDLVADRYMVVNAFFNFVTNATVANRDWSFDLRTPQSVSPFTVGHGYSFSHPTVQPASKNWIYSLSVGGGLFGNAAAGEVLNAPLPALWVPGNATIELGSTGVAGASDQFLNINVMIRPG